MQVQEEALREEPTRGLLALVMEELLAEPLAKEMSAIFLVGQ